METNKKFVWPVPESYSNGFPMNGEPGSFWENRGDRFHCGVDVYAPHESLVLAVDTGVVIDSGIFTIPELRSYWNKTFFIIIESQDGITYKYAELGDIFVKKGNSVNKGQTLGTVGLVLNATMITDDAPEYIQHLIQSGNPSMLHLEMYKSTDYNNINPYTGGNYFGSRKPDFLIDPGEYLDFNI